MGIGPLRDGTTRKQQIEWRNFRWCLIEKEYDTSPCEPLKHARFNILLID